MEGTEEAADQETTVPLAQDEDEQLVEPEQPKERPMPTFLERHYRESDAQAEEESEDDEDADDPAGKVHWCI